MKKRRVKRPLGRTVIVSGIIFTIIIVLVIGGLSYGIFNKRMMEQYREHLSSIMNLTIARIDTEDLKHCIETKEESEKFKELTVFFDQARVYYNVTSLTMVYPHKEGDKLKMMQVLSGLTPEGRNGEAEIEGVPIPLLGDDITDFLPPEFLTTAYNDYINNYEIQYTKTDLVYGKNYDAVYTIRDAEGNPVANLASSMSLDGITAVMRRYVLVTTGTILLLTGCFVTLLVEWLKHRVIRPLKLMGEQAEEFQRKSNEEDNPGFLDMSDASLHRGDEVEVLAITLGNMSRNMKDFVLRLVENATKMADMKEEVNRANELAMRDSMTGVKSKAAYEQQKERLDLDIKSGGAEFGIAMIDINYLKRINDTYGHEKGDIYIKKMCTMICDSFAHSPVFRVGGDEFVAVLVHRDYKNRNKIVEDLRRRMSEQFAKTELEEWQRPMAAIGIAIYEKDKDTDSDTVFKRADDAMYENTKEMKACRED